jgi:hypothetical protein
MRKKLLGILTLALATMKSELMGVRADAIIEVGSKASLYIPTNTPNFEAWCKEFNVSKNVPKRIVVSKEQIAEKFGISTNELIIA